MSKTTDVAFQVQLEKFMRSLIKSMDQRVWENFTPIESALLRVEMTRCGMSSYPEMGKQRIFNCADSNCECSQCGLLYSEHPLDWTQIGHGDVPFLNVLCDGERVKL